MKKLNIEKVRPIIDLAINEDFGDEDITSKLLLKKDKTAKADIVSREEIMVCGMEVAAEILRRYDERLMLRVHIKDGQAAHVGSRLGTIEGPLRAMLSAERVLLNFLQRLSGIAPPG